MKTLWVHTLSIVLSLLSGWSAESAGLWFRPDRHGIPQISSFSTLLSVCGFDSSGWFEITFYQITHYTLYYLLLRPNLHENPSRKTPNLPRQFDSLGDPFLFRVFSPLLSPAFSISNHGTVSEGKSSLLSPHLCPLIQWPRPPHCPRGIGWKSHPPPTNGLMRLVQSLFANGYRDTFFSTKHLARYMIIDSCLAFGSPSFPPRPSCRLSGTSLTMPILYTSDKYDQISISGEGNIPSHPDDTLSRKFLHDFHLPWLFSLPSIAEIHEDPRLSTWIHVGESGWRGVRGLEGSHIPSNYFCRLPIVDLPVPVPFD